MTRIAEATEAKPEAPPENGVRPMDDELATQPTPPQVWRPSQAKDRDSGGVAVIQRTIVRHRFEEAAMLAELVGRILGDVSSIAGADNGVATAVEARMMEASTLAQTIDRNGRDLFRPKGVDVQVVKRGDGA